MITLEKDEFLEKYNISNVDFTASGIEWKALLDIGNDHYENLESRKGTAEYFAKIIQGCKQVHSVRWRVKDPEHLMEKIVRKNIKKEGEEIPEKYKTINKENYHNVITDLVGVRAIHLFKDEHLSIDGYLREHWTPHETPTINIRKGDDDTEQDGFTIKQHPAGYRSVHYIFSSQPTKKIVFTEVQVRTIFEEGWSEIDHKVRYPNFSNEPQIAYFLNIFNRMAGSADEMGLFVKSLDRDLKEKAEELDDANEEIYGLLNELEQSRGQSETDKNIISSLKEKIKELNDNSTSSKVYGSQANSENVSGGLVIGSTLLAHNLGLTAAKGLGLTAAKGLGLYPDKDNDQK
ncbi:RelA/SpoT domain-containing protein [Aeromonas caviae]|uniref:RelA/SpoT domain-containing protein n=1 Tax=Aeromonas caviae TaxID=648 RepID=UPI002B477BBE|nr:RelA/SpoT domain-containing protein [Aeromonas caviae]